jgi:transposase, IS30 family
MKTNKTSKHLDRNDRNQIEILLSKKYKQKDIVLVLNVDKSTVSKEIKRHTCLDGIYRASVAQHKADIRRRNSKYQGMKIEADKDLKNKIVEALEKYQSPDGIAGRYGNISAKSIYKWLYSPYGQKYCKLLCTKRYKAKKHKNIMNKRQMIPNLVSIYQRPVRGTHWEGDLFVCSPKLGHSVSVALIAEQKTQYIKACKIPNRKPTSMVKAVNHLVKDALVSDITFDRGIENKYHRQFNVPSYFCDPHSPWQKPHVENNIGLMRRWFVPKKTDLKCMKQIDLDRYVSIINNKWRRSQGFKSSYENALLFGIIKE